MKLKRYRRLLRKAKAMGVSPESLMQRMKGIGGNGRSKIAMTGKFAQYCRCRDFVAGKCECSCVACQTGAHKVKLIGFKTENDDKDYGHGGSFYNTDNYHAYKARTYTPDYWALGYEIEFTKEAYEKMYFYCQHTQGEITGFGKLEVIRPTKDRGGVFRVLDVKIFKQEISSGSANMDEDSTAEFLCELAAEGESPSDWRLWWHTHYNFGVFWSATDDGNIDTIIRNFPGYLVSTCFNQSGSLIGRVDEIAESGKHESTDNVAYYQKIDNEPLKKRIVEEIKQKVSVKTYAANTIKGRWDYKEQRWIDDEDDVKAKGKKKGVKDSDEDKEVWGFVDGVYTKITDRWGNKVKNYDKRDDYRDYYGYGIHD